MSLNVFISFLNANQLVPIEMPTVGQHDHKTQQIGWQ